MPSSPLRRLQEALHADRLSPMLDEVVYQALLRWGGEHTSDNVYAGLRVEDADNSPDFGPLRVLMALSRLERRGRIRRHGIGVESTWEAIK